MLNKKGQNLIEYILLVAVVIGVCIIFFRRQGPMEKSLTKTLGTVDTSINALNAEIAFGNDKPTPLHSK